jgi:hypothetical protein
MAEQTFIIPLKPIHIDRHGCHLSVNAVLNKKKLHLILDTGASQSAFDKRRMELILGHGKFRKSNSLSTGLGTQSMESHLVKIGGIRLGNAVIGSLQVILLDLSHVNSAYAQMNMNTIDGVIGGDVLKKFNAVIDYGSMQLELRGGRGISRFKRTALKKRKPAAAKKRD